jgi:hypothetical protein
MSMPQVLATVKEALLDPDVGFTAAIEALADASVEIEIGYEYFGAESDDIQDNVTLASVAIAKVVDALRDFSDATQGTIVTVVDPISYDYGQFTGPTSHGFLATITLLERSTT